MVDRSSLASIEASLSISYGIGLEGDRCPFLIKAKCKDIRCRTSKTSETSRTSWIGNRNNSLLMSLVVNSKAMLIQTIKIR